jgi:excisionase family DNA binding protein
MKIKTIDKVGEKWLTTKELSDELCVSIRTIRRWIAEGRITPIKLSERNFRFHLPSVKSELLK